MIIFGALLSPFGHWPTPPPTLAQEKGYLKVISEVSRSEGEPDF
jgi:hypothetical protein